MLIVDDRSILQPQEAETMEKNTTRDKILMTGAHIVRMQGFNNTGIQEILDAAGVPKGSFYFYFRNKEEFGLEVIDLFTKIIRERQQATLEDFGVEPLARLRSFFALHIPIFEKDGFEGGCPLGNLAQEMSGLSDIFRRKIQSAILECSIPVRRCINEALEKGHLPEGIDPGELTDYLFNSWEGAILRSKVEKNAGPLLQFERMAFEHLLK